ncbi:MAG TPA: hypothetical protein V6D11_03790 [Waterburya sp.]|jgi:ABC-type Fe3+-siderophore transport system permease subunit
MNNVLVKLILFSVLLIMIIAPFAGIAPLMLVLVGLAIASMLWSLVQAFFTTEAQEGDKKV